MKKFKATRCEHCGQTTDYSISIDKGTAHILIAIYNAVKLKGMNKIHLRNEMECRASDFGSYREMIQAGRMTSRMTDNVLRAKYHGLVAQVDDGGKGEYLITRKGAAFIHGEEVARVAVVLKRSHTLSGYWNEQEDRVTITELMKGDTPFWEGALPKEADPTLFDYQGPQVVEI